MDLRLGNIIFDLKTLEDAKDFQKQVNNYKYYRQDTLYSLGYSKITGDDEPRFIFIAVEKKAPFGCILYELDYDYKVKGLAELNQDLEKYKIWKEWEDKTKIYDDKLVKLEKPSWL